MLVEQALFTSAQTRHARGYHLVACSPGISDGMAQALAVWGPTHDALVDTHSSADSLNYFQLDSDWAALSRTVSGESEYSNRGGLRLETNILVFRHGQLTEYDQNPLHLARTALALGHLRLRASTPTRLDRVELPDSSLAQDRTARTSCPTDLEVIERGLQEIGHGRVMVVGAEQPQTVLAAILDQLPEHERGTLTFTTGLKPSLHRTFRLQFLPEADATQQEQLAASEIACLHVSRSSVMPT